MEQEIDKLSNELVTHLVCNDYEQIEAFVEFNNRWFKVSVEPDES